MQATKRPRVKICCIASHDEATLAIEHGAAALGLVSAMPSGPGVIPEPLIAEIAAGVPPPLATLLLTARKDARGILAQHHRRRTSTIQIVDRLTLGLYDDLRSALPGIQSCRPYTSSARSRWRKRRYSTSRLTRSCWTQGIRRLPRRSWAAPEGGVSGL
jgi:phosphoribosylanthranilate isomerase